MKHNKELQKLLNMLKDMRIIKLRKFLFKKYIVMIIKINVKKK